MVMIKKEKNSKIIKKSKKKQQLDGKGNKRMQRKSLESKGYS